MQADLLPRWLQGFETSLLLENEMRRRNGNGCWSAVTHDVQNSQAAMLMKYHPAKPSDPVTAIAADRRLLLS